MTWLALSAFLYHGRKTSPPSFLPCNVLSKPLSPLHRNNSSTPETSALSRLPLREGKNSIDFRLENQETCVIASTFLFLWAKHDKIVVVDIDGRSPGTHGERVAGSAAKGGRCGWQGQR